MAETTYYRCSESTVEARTTTYRGHMIRYQSRNRTTGKMHAHLFWSSNNSRFGAIREFVRNMEARGCCVYRVLDIRQRYSSSVAYLDVTCFEDVE